MPIIAAIILVAIFSIITSLSTTTWAIIGGVFVALLAFLCIFPFTDTGKAHLAEEARKKEERGKLRELEERPSESFVVSHKYILRVNDTISKGVALDVPTKKIAIYDSGAWRELDWSEVISCDADITEDNVTHTTSSRSLLGAAVGGMTFGVAGAVVGGLGGKTTSTVSSKIQRTVMRLGFNDVERPIYELQFGAVVTEESLGEFREWIGRINAILVSNDKTAKAIG